MNRLRMFVCGLVSLGAAVASAGGLPPGYFRVSYIQGNAKDTRVITDYVPHPSTDKIVAEVEFVRDDNEGVWCSRGQGASASAWLLFRISKKCRFDYGVSSKSTTSTMALTVNTRYTFTAADNHVAISTAEGVAEEYDVADTTAGSLTESGGPLCLFYSYHSGVRGTTTYYGNFKLYSLKVYRKNAQTEEYELLYDLVPVQDAKREFRLFNATDNPISITHDGTFSGVPTTFVEQLAASANVVERSEAASGGNIIWRIGNDYMHIFTDATEVQNFTPAVNLNARILMVGGGGAGGTGSTWLGGGGGGGAGGMIDTNDVELVANTTYAVTVGAGGEAAEADNGTGGNGGSSSISALEVFAVGGGGGGGYTKAGSAGGSGGGGGANGGHSSSPRMPGGAGVPGQGNDGGTGSMAASNQASGAGGGGAEAAGEGTSTPTVPGAGGDGRVSNILGYDEVFAGGGGGGNGPAKEQASGGSGGGGYGGYHVSAVMSTSGENGQGGGGGGGSGAGNSGGIGTYYAGAGGSGIVIIRYHYTAQGEKDKIVVPLAISGLVYDGTEQQGVADGEGYTLSGHRETAAGTHTATATLKDPDNAEWADDGSTDPKSIEWSIAQAVNVWTAEAALSKTAWMVDEDTPADLTVPVAKYGTIVATLNDEAWDGKTLPTAVGNYTSVWSVVETTDFTGLSVTKTFEILPLPPPEDRNARYWNGTEWKGANSFVEALAAVPDGGIIELNRDESSATTIALKKSVTIRSSSAHDVRRKLLVTASTTLLNFNGEGCSFVISNLEVRVNHNAFSAVLVTLDKGALTLGNNLYMSKGSYSMGGLLTANAGTLNLDGVTMSNSFVKWGLIRAYNSTTVNLRDCDIHGISVGETQSIGSALDLPHSGGVLNVYGGSITNNGITQARYGQVYCAGTVNFFGGRPIIQDLGVKDANVIKLQGTFDEGASVGVVYGAAKGDPFGTYVSGDAASAQAFYLPKSDPELRGRKKVDKLVWKAFVQRGVVLIIR